MAIPKIEEPPHPRDGPEDAVPVHGECQLAAHAEEARRRRQGHVEYLADLMSLEVSKRRSVAYNAARSEAQLPLAQDAGRLRLQAAAEARPRRGARALRRATSWTMRTTSCLWAPSAPARRTWRLRWASPAASTRSACDSPRRPSSPTCCVEAKREGRLSRASSTSWRASTSSSSTSSATCPLTRRGRPALRLHHEGVRAPQPRRDDEPAVLPLDGGVRRRDGGRGRDRPHRAPRERLQDRGRELPARGRRRRAGVERRQAHGTAWPTPRTRADRAANCAPILAPHGGRPRACGPSGQGIKGGCAPYTLT